MILRISASAVFAALCGTSFGFAQAPTIPVAPPNVVQSSAPATKVEAFRPAAGTLFTIGFNELGSIGYNVTVDARELSDPRGLKVRGVIVTVIESQYRIERA